MCNNLTTPSNELVQYTAYCVYNFTTPVRVNNNTDNNMIMFCHYKYNILLLLLLYRRKCNEIAYTKRRYTRFCGLYIFH